MYQVTRQIIHNTTAVSLIQGNTRSAARASLILPKILTTRYGRESIRYQATKFYNEAPMAVRNLAHFTIFKQYLFQWLKDKLVSNISQYI